MKLHSNVVLEGIDMDIKFIVEHKLDFDNQKQVCKSKPKVQNFSVSESESATIISNHQFLS